MKEENWENLMMLVLFSSKYWITYFELDNFHLVAVRGCVVSFVISLHSQYTFVQFWSFHSYTPLLMSNSVFEMEAVYALSTCRQCWTIVNI